MSNSDLSRYSKRLVQYFWDPMPTNTDDTSIWCLGKQYTSEYAAIETSPSSHIEADTSFQESGSRTPVQTAEDEALQKGWPAPFIDDIESRIWMTYRAGFEAIQKSPDPTANSALSAFTRLKQLGNANHGFTSDTGWGCMIRSGQSLLANTISILKLGRGWRTGQNTSGERAILSLFADDPSAPFSIHRFVEHGAVACGKHPGEWFGPSATARCIQALTASHNPHDLRVYVRPDDSDVYQDAFLEIAQGVTENNDDEDDDDDHTRFHPTLILLGTRLGIDKINPVYWRSLCTTLEMPQSIGIAGGRPSSSHYFVGTQGHNLFYLDPHSTRPRLSIDPSTEEMATCHTRRLRRISVADMDPSMLIGFLITSEDEWRDWKGRVEGMGSMGDDGKPVVHVHDTTPVYSDVEPLDESSGIAGQERPSALDEVVSCDDDSGDEAGM